MIRSDDCRIALLACAIRPTWGLDAVSRLINGNVDKQSFGGLITLANRFRSDFLHPNFNIDAD